MSVVRDPTEEEKAAWLEHVKRACIDDEAPDPSKMPGASDTRSASQPVSRSSGALPGAFSTDDLDGGDVENCRRFPMPKGKHLFIFPLSSKDVIRLARWSGGIDPGIHKDDTDLQRQAKIEAATEEARAMQVVLCCFQDEQRKRRCFEKEDLDLVKDNLRSERIKSICGICDELSAEGIDRGYGDLHAFFVSGLACLSEWLSASDGWAGCPANLKVRTRGLISQWQPSN